MNVYHCENCSEKFSIICPGVGFFQGLHVVEKKQLLLDALAKHHDNKAKTAVMLSIDRKTLYMKLKKYGVL